MKYLYIISLLLLAACQGKQDHSSHEGHDHDTTKVYYTCSMDPQVMEPKPGKCPICKMELTPVKVSQLKINGVNLSQEQIHLANIKTKIVSIGYVDQQVFATSVIKENENNVHYINARVEGRVDKLFFKSKGAYINKGQAIYEIYSEMLTSAQSELINNQKLLSANPDDVLLKNIQQGLYNKFLLWGISLGQIERIKSLAKPQIPFPVLSPVSGSIRLVRITEGNTVMEGQPLFELTEYKSLWVDAQFYQNETAQIRPGDLVDVFIEGVDKESIVGKVVQVLPQVAPSSTINIVRILITPSNTWVRPGMQASIVLHKAGEKSLIVPSNAIIREKKGNTIWIKNKEGYFEPKMVHIGEVSGSRVEVLHGLHEGDEIVVSGSYLLQSEYIFKQGSNPMAGHNMKDM